MQNDHKINHLDLSLTLAEEIVAMRPAIQQRCREAFDSKQIEETRRNQILIALWFKALASFDRLVVDAHETRSECLHHLKTMIEMAIYACWVRGDETDSRARLIYGNAFGKIAFYNELCAKLNTGHKHEFDEWAGIYRALEALEFSGIEKSRLPPLEQVAEAEVRASSYMLYVTYSGLLAGLDLAFDILQDLSDALTMGLIQKFKTSEREGMRFNRRLPWQTHDLPGSKADPKATRPRVRRSLVEATRRRPQIDPSAPTCRTA